MIANQDTTLSSPNFSLSGEHLALLEYSPDRLFLAYFIIRKVRAPDREKTTNYPVMSRYTHILLSSPTYCKKELT